MYLGFFVYWSKKFKTKVNSVKDRKFLVNRWWRTRNSAIKRFTTQITTQKMAFHTSRVPNHCSLHSTNVLWKCSTNVFVNRTRDPFPTVSVSPSYSQYINHKIVLQKLPSVFCYHGNFDSVYVAGSCHVCYPVWRSVWSIQRWPSNLEWLLLKVIMTAWSCKVGRDSCGWYFGWHSQRLTDYMPITAKPPYFFIIFFASHCKQYISINLVSKHKSKIHSVLKISNAIVQKQ